MKKTLALLLCLVMLFTVLSVNVFADTTPSVTIDTTGSANYKSTTFKIKFNNFTELAGYNLSVNVPGLTVTDVKATNVKTYGDSKNYKQTGNVLNIMDVTSSTTPEITVYATINNQNGTPIDLSSGTCEFAASKSAKVSDVTFTPATINTYNGVPTGSYATTFLKTGSAITQPGGTNFYPYGSVMLADGTKLTKGADGSFAATSDVVVSHKQFAIPANNFGTYGVADNAEKTALLFANYAELAADTTYGTMLIRGDWDKFVEGENLNDVVNALYNNASASAEKVLKNNGALIGVRLVPQTKQLWSDGTVREYGIIVNSIYSEYDYLTVAYSVNADTPTLAPVFNGTSK